MKKFLFLWLLLLPTIAGAQKVEGRWTGVAGGGAMSLRINVEFDESGDGGKAQSPDQSAQWFPVSAVAYNDGEVTFTVNDWRFEYRGVFGDDGIIRGSVTQPGITLPLDFTYVIGEWEVLRRPQDPVDFPYIVEDITFPNGDIALAGTLTMPTECASRAVVLVSGSGQQDRDETLMEHKPFLVLSDYLTRRGIAVLRYDDRGFGKSGGNYMTSSVEDFATDAAAAIDYMRSRGFSKVGIVGHSEGGMVALMLAAEGRPDFIVALAAPGVDGRTLADSQFKAMLTATGLPQEVIEANRKINNAALEIILSTGDREEMAARMKELFAGTPSAGSEQLVIERNLLPVMQSILRFDPAKYYPRIACPVLAMNGEKDVQVIAALNLGGIRTGLAHNPDLTVISYPGLNHLFQTAETGSLDEYRKIEETFNEKVMQDIADWLLRGE